MASITKRKSKYSVVYDYYDEEGVRHQKWETWGTYAEAKRRKAEIEHKQTNNTFVKPSINLVVAHGNGRPCDCKIIEKSFNRLKEEAGLPNVVFHSLRHSSTTYKLKLNHGDIKATQGDTGHAQADMVTKVYAHILDEDRKVNAQKFESAFYANPDLRDVKPPAEQKTAIDLGVLIEQLKQSPELAQALAGLIVG